MTQTILPPPDVIEEMATQASIPDTEVCPQAVLYALSTPLFQAWIANIISGITPYEAAINEIRTAALTKIKRWR